MTKIYMIRHGEAEGNLFRRAHGQYDSNVTALGQKQIGALAERFRDIPVDALWSSDLNRTRSTATAILKYHPELTLHTDPALREISIGVWENRPWGNLKRDYPEQMDLFTHDPERWWVPGCEPFSVLTERIRRAVTSIGEQCDGKTVVIVSHGLAIRALLCDLKGIPSAEFDSLPYGDNTSVALFTLENGVLTPEWYNDTAHLPEELSTFSHQARCRQLQGHTRTDYNRFEPLDPRTERTLYTDCYEKTWMQSHGNLRGFVPSVYVATATAHAKYDPRCLVKLFSSERFAGMIELDPERGREEDCGWISLLYVEPSLRGMRLGVQLLGHAISYFRETGRTHIGLHVSQSNENAVGFYRHNGFEAVGQVEGVGGMLWRMELNITQRVFTL